MSNNNEAKKMKHAKTIISGFLAGVLISLGGLINVFILSNNPSASVLVKTVGAFMFSLGLLFICSFSFNLYTGKIGYVFEHKAHYIIELCESLIGNILGCIVIGLITKALRIYDTISPTLASLCEIKINDQWYSLLLLGYLCGIFVYLAVSIFKSTSLSSIARITGLILAVMAFVLLGCEHVIADIFYFVAAPQFNFYSLVPLLLILVGNSLGSISFHSLKKYIETDKKEETIN